MLLFARKKDLRIRSLTEGTPNYDVVIPVDGIKSALSLTWDAKSNTIFWTDVESSAISSAKVNGSDQTKIINNNIGEGIGDKIFDVFIMVY